MPPVYVAAAGLWLPGFGDAQSWSRSEPNVAVVAPTADILPAMIRRRASTLTRMAADAYAQATAGCDRSAIATVVGSAWGETAALAELLEQMAEPDGQPSPTRFAGSVHNAASGQLSIVTGLQGFATSIAAGTATTAMTLLESLALLASGHRAVAAVLADIEPPRALAHYPCANLAVALLLVADGDERMPQLRRLSHLQGEDAVVPPGWSAHIAANPCAGAARLCYAVLNGLPARVSLEPDGGPGWAVDVVPGAARSGGEVLA